jgi:hypothetical protein
MKKIITLLIAVIFFLTVSSYAQINKGSTLIGGILNLSSNNLKNPDSSLSKQTYFSILPSAGFAVNTNTILGFSLFYKTNTGSGSLYPFKTKDNGYGAGIFLRKYQLLLNRFYLFGEGNLMFDYESYNYTTHNISNAEYDSKAYGFSLNFTPGVAFSLTHKWQLEAGLQNLLSVNYTNSKEVSKNNSADQDFKENNFSLSSSFEPTSFNNIFIGLRFLINK